MANHPATFTFTRGTAITSAQLTATDADGNAITYAIASGTLPGGISLAANGALIGTPTAHTTALGITVTASASDGVLAGTAALTIRVVEMPSLIVTSLGELATPYDGQTTLREAIAFANSNADTSAITFAAGLTGTLNLQGALPVLTTNLSITGPDAATLSVRRFLGGDYRLFEIAGGATVSLTGLTVSGGSAGDGAGVLNAGALTLTECALRDHAAGGSGGALYNADGGSAALLRCTVSGCSAGTGGGVCSGNASLSLENCTISGNTASVRGGGVHALAATIVNATITANTAPTGGGLSTSSPGANLVQVRDTILAGNTGGDCTITGTAVRSNGWNLAGNGNGIAAFTASGDTTGATSASILLGPLQNNGGPTLTHELLTLSPAINHGGSPLLTDQRGVARPFSGVPDIGAVERDSLNTSSLVTTTVDENDGNSDPAFGTGTSLREAIAFANSDPGASVITFDPAVFAVRRTITLVSQLPSLTTPIQITAPAAGLVLEGSSARRIMQISSSAAVTLTNLTFAHGAAPSPGGGALHIIASTQPVTLVGCTFEGNTGLNGGAIYAQAGFTGGTVTLRQCTFSGNAATGEAGALAITQGRVLIESCTITNAAKGVFAFGTAQVTVSNTIIAGHTGDDVKWGGSANPFQSGGHNLIGTGNAAGVFTAAGDLTGVTAPQLGALALNGGPAPTLLPLPGSPAIDAGETALGADQRGLLRPQGSAPDIGAVETTGAPITPLVTTLEDSANSYDGLTSLREAIIFANGNADTTAITFAPGLTGTINLLSALPSLTTNLSITGPGAAALTVQRAVSQNFRIFAIAAGASVSLNGLAIAHGKMSAPGAGISNAGTLTITACRLSENAASGSHGGAISTTGTLLLEDSEISGNTAGQWGGGLYRPAGSGATTIRRCTLSGNTATYGGGLYAVECALTLESSTLSGNTAQQGAGAVFAALTPGAALTLAHCTITANTSSSAGGGMSVYTGQASRLQMTHCILAGNSPDDCDSYFATAAQSNGWNLIGTGYGSASFNAAGDQTGLTSAALLLGPLQANGGLTFTHLPLAGSPALDAANAARGTVPSTDQRGLPRIVRARIDIGACEAATAPGYETWIWQQLPAAATAAQHAPAADFDHDGQTNQDEWLALTRPHDSTSVFTPALNLTGPSAYIFFPSVVGRRYQLRQSSDLTTWTAAPGQPVMEGNGSVLAFAIPADTARAFYQVIPSLP